MAWKVEYRSQVFDLQTPHKLKQCTGEGYASGIVYFWRFAEKLLSGGEMIVRALEDDEIKALRDAAGIAGLDALYEIHEESELEKALKFAPKIVGVNNRDLKRFKTDLAVSELLIPQIPDDIVKVSESGIFNLEDAERASACGADAILVGEALMKAEDPEELIEAFHNA